MARFARQLWRRRSLFAQATAYCGRELDRRRRSQEKAIASRERPNVLTLPECGGGPARRVSRPPERAAPFLGTDHRRTECLYRPAVQFLQRRNSAADCTGGTVG